LKEMQPPTPALLAGLLQRSHDQPPEVQQLQEVLWVLDHPSLSQNVVPEWHQRSLRVWGHPTPQLAGLQALFPPILLSERVVAVSLQHPPLSSPRLRPQTLQCRHQEISEMRHHIRAQPVLEGSQDRRRSALLASPLNLS
jgi:hypothetical protein